MSVAAAFPTNYTQPQNLQDSQTMSPTNSAATTPTTDINSNTTSRTPNDLDEDVEEDVKNIKRSTPPNVYKGNPDGVTVLMYACQQDRETDVRGLLTQRPTMLEARDRTGKTALHYCAENETPTCADVLLNHDKSLIDIQDNDGYSTLHLAVIAGNNLFTKYLISKGAELNLLDCELHSVVHWAVVCGELEALDILLEAGADPSTADIHGAHPIHYAAQMCGPDQQNVIPGEPPGGGPRIGLLTLKKLLSKQVPVTVVDQDGRPPLLWAASSGSDDAILALVNAGASVEDADKDGLTALHCAASRGHVECLETLANLCGAEVDVIDTNGCSPLFYAVTLGHAECTKLLLKYGAQPNRQDRKGRTPAHCGAAKGQLETLRLVASHGGDMWIRNIRGDLPLHEAVQSTRKDLVIWLLNQKPEAVNSANNDGKCPLHIAALNDNIEMCKVLLDLQASVNPIMRTSKGQLATPLDAALHRGNRNCAKYLQLHGAVPAHKLTDKNALQRALALASIGQDLDSSQYLKSSTSSLPSVMTDEGVQTDEKLRVSKESQANGATKHNSTHEENHTMVTTRTKRHQKQRHHRKQRHEEDVAYSSQEYDTEDYYDDEDEENYSTGVMANKTDAQKKKRSKITSEDKYLAVTNKKHQQPEGRKGGSELKQKQGLVANGDQSVSKTRKNTVNAGEIINNKTVTTTKKITSRKTTVYEDEDSYDSDDEEDDVPKRERKKEKAIHVKGGGMVAGNYEAVDVQRIRREEKHQKHQKMTKKRNNYLETKEEHHEGSDYGHPSLEASEASGGKDSGFSEHYGSVRAGEDGRHYSGFTSRSEIDSRDQTRGSSRAASRSEDHVIKNSTRLEVENNHPNAKAKTKATSLKDNNNRNRKRTDTKIDEEEVSESEDDDDEEEDNRGMRKVGNNVAEKKQKVATTGKTVSRRPKQDHQAVTKGRVSRKSSKVDVSPPEGRLGDGVSRQRGIGKKGSKRMDGILEEEESHRNLKKYQLDVQDSEEEDQQRSEAASRKGRSKERHVEDHRQKALSNRSISREQKKMKGTRKTSRESIRPSKDVKERAKLSSKKSLPAARSSSPPSRRTIAERRSRVTRGHSMDEETVLSNKETRSSRYEGKVKPSEISKHRRNSKDAKHVNEEQEEEDDAEEEFEEREQEEDYDEDEDEDQEQEEENDEYHKYEASRKSEHYSKEKSTRSDENNRKKYEGREVGRRDSPNNKTSVHSKSQKKSLRMEENTEEEEQFGRRRHATSKGQSETKDSRPRRKKSSPNEYQSEDDQEDDEEEDRSERTSCKNNGPQVEDSFRSRMERDRTEESKTKGAKGRVKNRRDQQQEAPVNKQEVKKKTQAARKEVLPEEDGHQSRRKMQPQYDDLTPDDDDFSDQDMEQKKEPGKNSSKARPRDRSQQKIPTKQNQAAATSITTKKKGRLGSARRTTGASFKKKKSKASENAAKAKLVASGEKKANLNEYKDDAEEEALASLVDNKEHEEGAKDGKKEKKKTESKQNNNDHTDSTVFEPEVEKKKAPVINGEAPIEQMKENTNGNSGTQMVEELKKTVTITDSSETSSKPAGSVQKTKALVHREKTNSEEATEPRFTVNKQNVGDQISGEDNKEEFLNTAQESEENTNIAKADNIPEKKATLVAVSEQPEVEVGLALEEEADDQQGGEEEDEPSPTLPHPSVGSKPRKLSASGKAKNQRPRLTTPSKASMASKNTFKGKPSKTLKQTQKGEKQTSDSKPMIVGNSGPADAIDLAIAARNGHIPVNPTDPVAVRNKVRKYELERKIFQELLELKRLQVRSGKANEQVLVKRLVDTYKKEGLLGVKPFDGSYTFASFEKHLYDQLKSIQNPNLLKGLALKPPKDEEGNITSRSEAVIDSAATKRELSTWMQGRVAALMAADELAADAESLEIPSQCTHRTHTCHHAAHAYTGVPCAAYITRPNHHHNIKGPSRPFLPKIERHHGGGAATEPVALKNFDPTRPLTLELNHGGTRQLIEFPANKLDRNRKYHVTFTIKPTTPLIDEELAKVDGGRRTPPVAPLRRPMPAGVSVQELQKQLSSL